MSTVPVSDPYNINVNDEDSELMLSPLDDSLENLWSLLYDQEISQSAQKVINNISRSTTDEATVTDSAAGLLVADGINDLKLMKIGSLKSRINKKNCKSNNNEKYHAAAMEQSADEAGLSSAMKLDHNAKERIRRMKLNASFLALRALLPDQYSRRSKKRWSAPAIVDRVLKYIPELESEVEALRSQKEQYYMQSEAKNKKLKLPTTSDDDEYQSPTVSLNKVNEEEAIIQICMACRSTEDELQYYFMNLLQSMEDEGICLKSASALHICESRICYHLHIQINNAASEADSCIEELRDKVISWLIDDKY